MKAVVIGANGQLGSDLVEALQRAQHEVVGLTHQDIQIENLARVQDVLESAMPDVILNTAAFHNVPKCEEDPMQSFQVNTLGALNLAKIASKLNSINVYYSTDYVFDGSKRSPYVETDLPNPLNVYASTKLSGEYHTLNYGERGYVIRVSGLYGKVPCRAKAGNFITTMIRLAKEKPEVRVVQDEILSPTPTREIAEKTVDLVKSDAYGLFHLTSEGQCSWYEYAKVIFETLRLKTPLFPSSVLDSPIAVKRPFYSVLENRRAKEVGIRLMPTWKESLVEFLGKAYL